MNVTPAGLDQSPGLVAIAIHTTAELGQLVDCPVGCLVDELGIWRYL